MKRYATVAVLLALLFATTTYGQDEDASLGIEYCRWLSILAKEIMTARQQDKPMSETLPFALDRLRDFPKDIGVDIEELSEDLEEEEQAEMHAEMLAVIENYFQEMKPIITQLVMGAYEAPVFTDEKTQRRWISDLENAVFASCYEEDLQAAQNSSEAQVYQNMITQRVRRNWARPGTARDDLKCIVSVQQVPGGTVVSARVIECNGDDIVRRSVEAAVYRASPLPQPSNPLLFLRTFQITFTIED